MGRERRRYHRTTLGVDISLEVAGRQWQAKTINLSPYGAKVARLPNVGTLLDGTSVQLRLPAVGQEPPLCLTANVERTESDGIALSFPALGDQQLQRLKDLVDSLLLREWQELASQLVDAKTPEKVGAAAASAVPTPKSAEGERPLAPREPADDGEAERERWQALLHRLGFEHIQLPRDGTLARQWREFLKRHEVEPPEKGR